MIGSNQPDFRHEKSIFSKLYVFYPELFSTLTQWHGVQLLCIIPSRSYQRFSRNTIFVKWMGQISQISDTKNQFSRNCKFFVQNFFSTLAQWNGMQLSCIIPFRLYQWFSSNTIFVKWMGQISQIFDTKNRFSQNFIFFIRSFSQSSLNGMECNYCA